MPFGRKTPPRITLWPRRRLNPHLIPEGRFQLSYTAGKMLEGFIRGRALFSFRDACQWSSLDATLERSRLSHGVAVLPSDRELARVADEALVHDDRFRLSDAADFMPGVHARHEDRIPRLEVVIEV